MPLHNLNIDGADKPREIRSPSVADDLWTQLEQKSINNGTLIIIVVSGRANESVGFDGREVSIFITNNVLFGAYVTPN